MSKWLESSPLWFDDFAKSLIPDWIVEDKMILKKLRNNNNVEITREFSGANLLLGGTVRNMIINVERSFKDAN